MTIFGEQNDQKHQANQMNHSSDHFNRYSYCWNNPLRYTDPSGQVIGEMLMVWAGNYVINFPDNVINWMVYPGEYQSVTSLANKVSLVSVGVKLGVCF